jgi:hypothetical protein
LERQRSFPTIYPLFKDLLYILGLTCSVLIVDELRKLFRGRRKRRVYKHRKLSTASDPHLMV